MTELTGSEAAALYTEKMARLQAVDRELAHFKERAGAPREVRLGCSTISHDRLGFCAGCVPAKRDHGPNGSELELLCWRLLALREDRT